MTPTVSQGAIVLLGVGLTLGGGLMLIRPELFRGHPPDQDLTSRSTRIGGLVLVAFGIAILWQLLVYGVVPCAPNECSTF